MKRSKRHNTKPLGLNPHDGFVRKVMSDPRIAADILRHYTDPVIAKYVDLDNLSNPIPALKPWTIRFQCRHSGVIGNMKLRRSIG